MTAPTCESCSAGTYSSGVGSVLSCTSCPLNAISAVGASVCVPASRYYDLGASLLAYYPFNPGQMLMDISGRLGSLTTPQAAPIADCKTADAGLQLCVGKAGKCSAEICQPVGAVSEPA